MQHEESLRLVLVVLSFSLISDLCRLRMCACVCACVRVSGGGFCECVSVVVETLLPFVARSELFILRPV